MTAPGDADAVTGVVTEVRAPHRFDEAALARYLRGRIPGVEAGLAVRQFEGGQSNPTYLLETPAGRWVLRKKPGGPLLPSAHMIEREHRIMTALHGSAVPVPEVPVLCEDTSVLGTAFFVMSYVHGRIIRDPALAEVPADERTATLLAGIAALATLHDVDWAARGLADFGKPGHYVGRQLARWSRQYASAQAAQGAPAIPAMDWLIAWLPAHLPAEPPVTIAHGDFRVDNLVFHPTEPRVLAVLDWELSTLGDPFADLAHFCMPYHLRAGQSGVRGLGGLDLAARQLPREDELVAAYCARRGVAVPPPATWAFYAAFAQFRMAAIAAGIAARLAQGNASSGSAHEIAAQVATFAEAGRALVAA